MHYGEWNECSQSSKQLNSLNFIVQHFNRIKCIIKWHLMRKSLSQKNTFLAIQLFQFFNFFFLIATFQARVCIGMYCVFLKLSFGSNSFLNLFIHLSKIRVGWQSRSSVHRIVCHLYKILSTQCQKKRRNPLFYRSAN